MARTVELIQNAKTDSVENVGTRNKTNTLESQISGLLPFNKSTNMNFKATTSYNGARYLQLKDSVQSTDDLSVVINLLSVQCNV